MKTIGEKISLNSLRLRTHLRRDINIKHVKELNELK